VFLTGFLDFLTESSCAAAMLARLQKTLILGKSMETRILSFASHAFLPRPRGVVCVPRVVDWVHV
jgi:hypothetical protein